MNTESTNSRLNHGSEGWCGLIVADLNKIMGLSVTLIQVTTRV